MSSEPVIIDLKVVVMLILSNIAVFNFIKFVIFLPGGFLTSSFFIFILLSYVILILYRKLISDFNIPEQEQKIKRNKFLSIIVFPNLCAFGLVSWNLVSDNIAILVVLVSLLALFFGYYLRNKITEITEYPKKGDSVVIYATSMISLYGLTLLQTLLALYG